MTARRDLALGALLLDVDSAILAWRKNRLTTDGAITAIEARIAIWKAHADQPNEHTGGIMSHPHSQAFARPASRIAKDEAVYDAHFQPAQPGMTLRDYFAAHAPTVPQAWFMPTLPESERCAQWPYAWADAVIATDRRLNEPH